MATQTKAWLPKARIPTWALEQAVLLGLLVAAWLEQRHGASVRADATTLLSSLAVLAGQKVRSMADRQREADELAGVDRAAMSCSGRVQTWGMTAQALGLVSGVIMSPSWPHALIALYVALYGTWRRVYRARRPAGRKRE